MSTISSLPSGIETPQVIELRKESRGRGSTTEKTLYTVLPQNQTKIKGFMGSSHSYSIPGNASSSSAATPSIDEGGDAILLNEEKKQQVAKEKKKFKDKDFKF